MFEASERNVRPRGCFDVAMQDLAPRFREEPSRLKSGRWSNCAAAYCTIGAQGAAKAVIVQGALEHEEQSDRLQ